MKKTNKILTAVAGLVALGLSTFAQSPIAVQGHITANTKWFRTNQYKLVGCVYVDSAKTLTIESGTVIFGDTNQTPTVGALIISRGAKIVAIGKINQPIVFTSLRPSGKRAAGDWGGIAIAGRAPVNKANAFLEGGTPGAQLTNPAGYYVPFGGTNNADNSGSFRFVRIEYAGFPFSTNNELNSLTMGGVGNRTTIDHVQVSYAKDDAFEWFGGSVNGSYLVSYKTVDDCFDTDNGHTGKIQFALSWRDANIADISKSHAFESDNDATGSAALPKTRCAFTNITCIGPRTCTSTISSNYVRAAHLRRNTEIAIYNSLFVGYPDGLVIDGDSSVKKASANLLKLRANVVSYMSGLDFTTISNPTQTLTPSNAGWFLAQKDSGTTYYPNISNLAWRFTCAQNDTAKNWTLQAGSKLRQGADTNDARYRAASNFIHVPYRGAFASYDWTTQWTEFNPQAKAYCLGCTLKEGQLEEEVVSGTEEGKLGVFPNPAAGSFVTFTFDSSVEGTGSVFVYDMMGKQVAEFNQQIVEGYNQIEVENNFATGYYIVKYTNGKEVRTGKMVITK
jgi:hypothetical protein